MNFLKFTLLFLFPVILFAQGEESISKIGESADVSYVMYTSNNGDLYYINTNNNLLSLLKYELETGNTSVISNNFSDVSSSSEGFGAIAPTVTGDTIYCMTSKSSGNIYRLICSQNKFEYLTSICGSNWWKIFNLTLSKDGKSLFYVSNNNLAQNKGIRKIDLETLECTEVLELDNLIPHRDLCFGGINVWDDYGNFYAPVWSYNYDDSDLAILKVHAEEGNYSAELIHFTDDGTENGNSLFPGFRHNSCWSGIGVSSKGNIYIGASDHYQTSTVGGNYGNVAIYKYNPNQEQMSLLGDLKSTSTAVNNWMEYESQHKIHTFIMENADGKMYFASDDYYPSHFIRGAHIYTIDIETDELRDYSKTQPYVIKRDFSVVENLNYASETSGVFCEYYGIKGIALNPKSPEYLYAMTYSSPSGVVDPGYIIKHKIESVNLSTTNIHLENAITVYPNPFVDNTMFDLRELNHKDGIVLNVFDINGQLIFVDENCNNEVYTWESGRINKGIYLYSIRSKNKIIVGKIIKR